MNSADSAVHCSEYVAWSCGRRHVISSENTVWMYSAHRV